MWLILSHKLFNQEKRLYTTAYGSVLCAEEMLKVHDETYINQIFEINKRIQALKLNYDETCLLGAFVMMTPGKFQRLSWF